MKLCHSQTSWANESKKFTKQSNICFKNSRWGLLCLLRVLCVCLLLKEHRGQTGSVTLLRLPIVLGSFGVYEAGPGGVYPGRTAWHCMYHRSHSQRGQGEADREYWPTPLSLTCPETLGDSTCSIRWLGKYEDWFFLSFWKNCVCRAYRCKWLLF